MGNWNFLRTPAFRGTSRLVVVVIAAFFLGHYTSQFSGSGWAWAALVGWLLILAVNFYSVVADFWQSK